MTKHQMPVQADHGTVDIGCRYGRLMVVGLLPHPKNPKALCRCDCGEIVAPQRGALKNGRAKSCGCLRVDLFTEMSRRREKLDPEESRRRNNAAAARCHRNNRDAARERSRRHRARHKQKCKSYQHVRRARMKAARVGVYDAGIEGRLWGAQKGRCAACSKGLMRLGHHVDHIKPLARGGAHENVNLQLLCPTCNLSKGAKDPVDFMQSLGKLL